ncbi:MAG: choice-of-anchor tandem repeat GloVer-containing protein [Cyclobacteriaceae bacterium]|nr:choice-of-anchor tandem repeat GloVer-containing protein [Cyclobacteriaceae bacterium]
MKKVFGIHIIETILTFILILTVGMFSYGQKSGENHKASRTSSSRLTILYDFYYQTDGDATTKILTIPPWLITLHENGGSLGHGSILKMRYDGTDISRWLAWDASRTDIEVADTTLFGAQRLGGVNDNGLLFKTNITGSSWTTLHGFEYMFGWPRYNFVVANNTIYGVGYEAFGGNGYLFSIGTDGSNFEKTSDLYGYPHLEIVHDGFIYGTGFNQTGRFERVKVDGTEPVTFESPAWPLTNTTMVIDNVLYGLTYSDGEYGMGTLWKMNPDGSNFAALYSFTTLDGIPFKIVPSGDFIYGTSMSGGNNGLGRIFSFNKNGSNYRKLYDFESADNVANPHDFIVVGDTIFGLAVGGGAHGIGAIYKYIIGELPPLPKEPIKIIVLQIKPPEILDIYTTPYLAVAEGTYVNLDTTVSLTGNIGYDYSWNSMKNGTLTETGNIVQINHDSTFYIIASTEEGCVFSDSTLLRIKRITGTPGTEESRFISLFPNPNQGRFYLRTSFGLREYTFEVLDAAGKIIHSGRIADELGNDHLITLQNARVGTYTLVLKQGSFVLATYKFLVLR